MTTAMTPVRRAAWRAVRSLQARPPVRSRHWQDGPPDFVGVGVQRAGTSWWFSLIESHPDVHPRGPTKELHFFDERSDGPLSPDDIAAYHRLFRRPPGTRMGEWTPRYLLDPWTPPRLAEAAPDARLLVMLRDPMDRLRSGLTHAQARTGRIEPDALLAAIQRGLYHEQLLRLVQHFPREQVLVLQFERARADRRGELRRTLDFLGLDPLDLPDRPERARNSTASAKVELAPDVAEQILATYRADLDRLTEIVPDLDLTLWSTSR